MMKNIDVRPWAAGTQTTVGKQRIIGDPALPHSTSQHFQKEISVEFTTSGPVCFDARRRYVMIQQAGMILTIMNVFD